MRTDEMIGCGCGCAGDCGGNSNLGQLDIANLYNTAFSAPAPGEEKPPLFTVGVEFPRNQLVNLGATIGISIIAANAIGRMFGKKVK